MWSVFQHLQFWGLVYWMGIFLLAASLILDRFRFWWMGIRFEGRRSLWLAVGAWFVTCLFVSIEPAARFVHPFAWVPCPFVVAYSIFRFYSW